MNLYRVQEQGKMSLTVRLTPLIFQQYKIGFKVELQKLVRNTMGNTKLTSVHLQFLDARMVRTANTGNRKQHQSQL